MSHFLRFAARNSTAFIVVVVFLTALVTSPRLRSPSPASAAEVITQKTQKDSVRPNAVSATITWIGGTTNWHTNTNWNPATVPGATDDVIIPSGAPTQPTISTADATINFLTIQVGGTLTMGSGRTLNVAGDWANSGTFTAGNGTVVCNGTTARMITGTSVTTFNNLTISDAAGVDLRVAGTTVNGALTLTQGVFTTGGGSNKPVTLGNGASISRSGGSISHAPVFGSSVNVIYTAPSPAASITTGPELPVSTTVLKDLTIDNPSGVTLNANATVNGNLTVTNGIFDLQGNSLNGSGAAGSTLTVANGTTLRIGGTNSLPANFLTYSVGPASTIEYSGTTQTVAQLPYGNLIISGSGTKALVGNISVASNLTINGGTLDAGALSWDILIAGNWTNNVAAANFNPRAAAVTFSGNVTQSIAGTATNQTFNHLTVNKAANSLRVVGSTTTLNLNGTLAISAGTFNAGTASTINAGGSWTNSGTFTSGSGTVVFNGNNNTQTLSGNTTFNNLTINHTGTGNVTASGSTLTVSGLLRVQAGSFISSSTLNNVQIDPPATLQSNGGTMNVSGNWTNDGTFIAGTGTVVCNGASAQTIGGSSATTFNNLTINNASGVTLGANATVNVLLTLTSGDLKTGPTGTEFTLTMPAAATSGPATGATDVVGNIKRTGFVSGGAALSFGNPFNTIQINSGTAPTDITVNLDKAVPTTPAPFAGAIARKYTITPNGGSGISATLRLHYLDTELNGNTEGSGLNLFRFDGTNWHKEGQTANDTTDNWVQKGAVTQFSPWTMNSTVPTAVKLDYFAATGYDGGAFIEWRTGNEVDNLGFNIYRDEGGNRVAVNSQLVAGSALVAGAGVTLGAGRSYGWWDRGAQGNAINQYWIESIDLNCKSEWHGPIIAKNVGGASPSRIQAEFLSSLSNSEIGITRPVEVAARLTGPTQLQNDLAGSHALKLSVKREGFYRVSAAELFAAGLDPGVDPRLLRMFVDGQPQPISVVGENDGRLDPSDVVEFYGVGLDSASSDTRVYWLAAGAQPGERIPNVREPGLPVTQASFPYAIERKDRTLYFAALRNGEKENFFGAAIIRTPVDQALSIEHLDTASGEQATAEVALQGVTGLPHRVAVQLNGVDLGEINFSGLAQGNLKLAISNSLLKEGANTFTLTPLGGDNDVSLVDYIRLTYQHRFTADGDALRLTLPGKRQVTIDGFSTSDVRVIDVTDPNDVQEVLGAIRPLNGSYAVTFSAPSLGDRRLFAFTGSRVSSVSGISQNQPSRLRQPNNGANLLIISNRELSSSLTPLVSLRQQQGLSVNVIDIEDVFDEFSFGEKSPNAVKEFLAYAAANWKKKLSYVLFAGDASADPKNYLGFGDWDLVPTRLIDTQLMETASDDWFADFNDDGLADMAVGRLPARTREELAVMVTKIVNYDNSPPSEEVLLVADANNGYDFEAANAVLRTLVPANLRVQEIDRGRLDGETAKKLLMEAIDRGMKIVNYAGHGSIDLWSGNLLTAEDARGLTNGERLPVFVMMTCLNGYFQDPALGSLAEALMKSEQGGAVAVWTSSSMTAPDGQAMINQQAYRLIFDRSSVPVRLGAATRSAKQAVSDADIRRTWILMGDPTMVLK